MIPAQRQTECGWVSWCTGEHPAVGGKHRSDPVTVGERQTGGTVSVLLVEAPGGPVRAAVNVCEMVGMGVDISVPDLQVLRDAITGLLERYEKA